MDKYFIEDHKTKLKELLGAMEYFAGHIAMECPIVYSSYMEEIITDVEDIISGFDSFCEHGMKHTVEGEG